MSNSKEQLNQDNWDNEWETRNLKQFVDKRLSPEKASILKDEIVFTSNQARTITDLHHRQVLLATLKDIKIFSSKNNTKTNASFFKDFVEEILTKPGTIPDLVFIWLALLIADNTQASLSAENAYLLNVLIEQSSESNRNLPFLVYGVYIARLSHFRMAKPDSILRELLPEIVKHTNNNELQATIIAKVQTAITYWLNEIKSSGWESIKVPVSIITRSLAENEYDSTSNATDEPKSRILLNEGRLPTLDKMFLGLSKGVPTKKSTHYSPKLLPVTLGVEGSVIKSEDIKSTIFFAHLELPSLAPQRLNNLETENPSQFTISLAKITDIIESNHTPPNSLGSISYWLAVRLLDNVNQRWNHIYDYEPETEQPNFASLSSPEQKAFVEKLNKRKLSALMKAIQYVFSAATEPIRTLQYTQNDQATTVSISMLEQAYIDAYGLTAFLKSLHSELQHNNWASIRQQLLSAILKDIISLTVTHFDSHNYFDIQSEEWVQAEKPIRSYQLVNREEITEKIKQNWLENLSPDDKATFALIHASSHLSIQDIEKLSATLSRKVFHLKNNLHQSVSEGGFDLPELTERERFWLLEYFNENKQQIQLRWQTIRNKSFFTDPEQA